MNDGIDKYLCSLSYTSVDVIADQVLTVGVGALLAKMDVKQAYWIISIHPARGPIPAGNAVVRQCVR